MPTKLNFGKNSQLCLDLSEEVLIADCQPQGQPLADSVKAITAALETPIDLPPLSDSTVPGDRVAIALEPGLSHVRHVLKGVVNALLHAGTEPENISVVHFEPKSKSAKHPIVSELPPDIVERIELVRHDPTDRETLSFLGASRDEKSIYLNRVLCDADLVIPVGELKPTDSLGYRGIFGGIFPAFADYETQQRFNAPRSSLSADQRKKREAESAEAAWLLGTQLMLQTVPGPGESILHALAGTGNAIMKQGREMCDASWTFQVPQRASLVVATIEGDRQQQTWNNFARTLHAALQIVEDDGAIAICSDLKAKPGPVLKRVGNADSLESASDFASKDRSKDALIAAQLINALRRVRVYLLSKLDEQTVNDLGVAYVSSAKEIANLSSRHPSCIVLGNAHHAIATVSCD